METGLTIQQVSQLTGLSIDTLRYYERIGLIDPVRRASSGHRRYIQQDVSRIDVIIRLRATGMARSEMVRFVQLRRLGAATATERRVMLEQHQCALERHMQELEEHGAIRGERARCAFCRHREPQSLGISHRHLRAEGIPLVERGHTPARQFNRGGDTMQSEQAMAKEFNSKIWVSTNRIYAR